MRVRIYFYFSCVAMAEYVSCVSITGRCENCRSLSESVELMRKNVERYKRQLPKQSVGVLYILYVVYIRIYLGSVALFVV